MTDPIDLKRRQIDDLEAAWPTPRPLEVETAIRRLKREVGAPVDAEPLDGPASIISALEVERDILRDALDSTTAALNEATRRLALLQEAYDTLCHFRAEPIQAAPADDPAPVVDQPTVATPAPAPEQDQTQDPGADPG